MQIEFDTGKRKKTLVLRGLDFARAAEVFTGVTVTVPDSRHNYGEPHFVTVGSRRAHGCHGLDAPRRCTPHYQYEESQ